MKKTPVYLVASPIGDQMSDFSLAAIRCIENTRHLFLEADDGFAARMRKLKLLTDRHLVSFLDRPHVETARELIERGEPFAILASSGVPCFVDPGHEIVDFVLEQALDRAELIPLGMSSALAAALAMSGRDLQQFVFPGHYPEHHRVDARLAEQPLPVVCFVRGEVVRAFVDHARALLGPWRRMLLLKDIRKRSRSAIYVIRDETPPELCDDRDASFVALIDGHRGERGASDLPLTVGAVGGG